MYFLRSSAIEVVSGEDLAGALVADDDVLLAGDDDQQGRGRDVGQLGLARGEDLAGEDGDDRPGDGKVGLGGHRRHLRGEVPAGRVAHDRELRPIGPDVRRRRRQDVERVADGDQAVGEEIRGGRRPVSLVSGGDHDPPSADQMVDPGPVDPRIDREPAVVEDHHGRRLGRRVGGLEQPVRPRPGPDLDLPDRLVGIRRRVVRQDRSGRGNRDDESRKNGKAPRDREFPRAHADRPMGVNHGIHASQVVRRRSGERMPPAGFTAVILPIDPILSDQFLGFVDVPLGDRFRPDGLLLLVLRGGR